jgi:hypothetical protein
MPNLDLYYRKCVIGGPRSSIVVANDFKSFSRAIRRKLILETAGRSPADAATPIDKRSIPVARGRTAPPATSASGGGEKGSGIKEVRAQREIFVRENPR